MAVQPRKAWADGRRFAVRDAGAFRKDRNRAAAVPGRIGCLQHGAKRAGGALAIDRDHAIAPRQPAPERDRRKLRLRSEEHTSELQSLMRISYAVFCLKKKNIKKPKN